MFWAWYSDQSRISWPDGRDNDFAKGKWPKDLGKLILRYFNEGLYEGERQ